MILRQLKVVALERIPLVAWLAFPVPLSMLLLFLTDNHVLVVVVSCLLSLGSAVLATVATGWVSLPQLAQLSPSDIRGQRRLLVQQQEVLRSAVAQLSNTTVESRRATTRLVGELVRAEETVRAHLAGELHDTVAQTLSAALMALETVEAPSHREGRETVRDAENQLRAVLARIRPPDLVKGTLASAIAELCLEIEHRYGCHVVVRWQDTPRDLTSAMATLVYRVVQESLMNSVEHADGVGLCLTVWVEQSSTLLETLCVVISDDGPGFDPLSVVSIGGRHVGLKLARERACIAGGQLSVESTPGAGTRIRLELPVGVAVDGYRGAFSLQRDPAVA